MVIRRLSLKKPLWLCVWLLIALGFPIQVYTHSPYPALLPYVLVALIVSLGVKRQSIRGPHSPATGIDLIVFVYAAAVVIGTDLQIVFNVIEFNEGTSALVNYLLPVICYWYFSSVASEEEIQWSIRAIAVAGLVGGIYFAYDSYVKLALGHVTAYSQAAFQYSYSRAGAPAGLPNEGRIAVGYRSFGLMESNAVSGAWIVLGALATLALVSYRRKVLRLAVVVLFGALSLLALNFTAMVAFVFIMYLLEFSGMTFRKHWKRRIVISLISLVFTVAILTGIALWVAGGEMSQFVVHNLTAQLDLALGLGNGGLTYGELVKRYLRVYYEVSSNSPPVILVGQGFSSYGYPHGGDVGFLQSLATFGAPAFVIILFGLGRLVFRGTSRIRALAGTKTVWKSAGLARRCALQFSVGVTLLVLVTDLHYSVWPSKSVLPVVFFAIALYARYMPGETSTISMEQEIGNHTRA